MFKSTVYVGRFQPIHRAHLKTIFESLKISEKVIIAIGSSKRAPHVKNPWSANERQQMILEALNEYAIKEEPTKYGIKACHWIKDKVKFIHVRDYKYNNVHWAQEVYSKALLAGATPDDKTRLTGCYKDDSSFYLKMFPQWTKDLVEEVKGVNATDVREKLFKTGTPYQLSKHLMSCTATQLIAWINTPQGQALQDEYFFLQDYHASWSKAPFKPVFVTVDAVVIKSGHILLIQRGRNPGKGLYALPGGFVDQDESIEDSVIRELKEETGLKFDETDAVAPILRRNIKLTHVFDHPKRSERGRTITHAFLIDLGEGPLPRIEAGDDASHAHWIPLAEMGAIEDKMYEDHFDIITYMTRRL